MDYFIDVFTTFTSYIAVYVRKLLDFIKNILICVPKINEGITHL